MKLNREKGSKNVSYRAPKGPHRGMEDRLDRRLGESADGPDIVERTQNKTYRYNERWGKEETKTKHDLREYARVISARKAASEALPDGKTGYKEDAASVSARIQRTAVGKKDKYK